MQHLDHESTKASISIKFPDIYANSPTPSPSLNASNQHNSGNNGNGTPRSTLSSNSSNSLYELGKFQKDVERVEELIESDQRPDVELAEVKNELIKTIVNTLMMNKYVIYQYRFKNVSFF